VSRTIEVLSPAGHVLLTWDPADQASVDRARAEFQALEAAGYEFFRVESQTPERAFSSTAGALVVKRVEAAEVAPRAEPLSAPAPRRRGRPPKNATPTTEARAQTERVVATRPMRGG